MHIFGMKESSNPFFVLIGKNTYYSYITVLLSLKTGWRTNDFNRPTNNSNNGPTKKTFKQLQSSQSYLLRIKEFIQLSVYFPIIVFLTIFKTGRQSQLICLGQILLVQDITSMKKSVKAKLNKSDDQRIECLQMQNVNAINNQQNLSKN